MTAMYISRGRSPRRDGTGATDASVAASGLRRKRAVEVRVRSHSSPAVFETSSTVPSSPSVSPSEGTMGLSVSSVDGDASSASAEEPAPLRWADDVQDDEDLFTMESLPQPPQFYFEVPAAIPFPHNHVLETGYRFAEPDWTPPAMTWFEPAPGICSCRSCNPHGGNWDMFFQVPPAHLTAHLYPAPAVMVTMKKKRRRGRRGRGKGKKKAESEDDSEVEEEE